MIHIYSVVYIFIVSFLASLVEGSIAKQERDAGQRLISEPPAYTCRVSLKIIIGLK